MIEQLLEDASELPRVFVWRGPLNPDEVNGWVSPNRVQIPADLKSLWIATGGGDIFESETILSPLSNNSEFDIQETNEFYWKSGIDKRLLIFHVGSWISAVRNEKPHYVSLSVDNFDIRAEFEDLDAWYLQTLRKEYAQRYALEGLR